MIIPKKKDALRELALSLFLMLEFNPDTASYSLVEQIRERAASALRSAAAYTGVIGQNDVQDFLNSRPLKFSIPCKGDIVKGDTIRFIEDAYDGRRNPPRWLGKRNVTAAITGIRPNNGDSMLMMKVIACVGAWELKPDEEIRRPLRVIGRSDVKRIPWDNEDERKRMKDRPTANPRTMKAAAVETFTLKKKPH
jgi:hypothetical protein